MTNLMTKSGMRTKKAMIAVDAMRRLINHDTDAVIRFLEPTEDHLCHWLLSGSFTFVREN